MQYCNNNGSDDEDDQKCLATTTPFDGQVLILSESGKPIFYSKGDEDEICSFFGVISIIVQRYHSLGNEDGRDSLLSIQRRDLFFQFLYRSPLILCLVSRQPCNLHIQLDTIYNQIISMFSRKMLREYYQKRGSNFDIRSLFGIFFNFLKIFFNFLYGIDKRVEACKKGFNEDPAILYGFRILPLSPTDRDFLVQTMGNIINETCPNVVAFGLLIAHRQLVALVRFKRLNLDAPDFNTIVNLIECHKANMIHSDHQFPFCLPKFDPNQFLYAYISYLWEGTGPCLVLLSITNSDYEKLTQIRPKLEENISSYKYNTRLVSALSNPEGFCLQENIKWAEQLWHFIYKNTSNTQDPTQVCCSTPKKPFISYQELILLYNGYTKLADLLRKSGGGIKMLFQMLERYVLFAWITTSFELYCTFSPFTNQKKAMEIAERLLHVLRKEEKRVLFSCSPAILVG
uniref:Vacuolar fusion protein MON1 homolog n=1 Tax=Meloidogyne floridensis TaxID=298350 RepID=A0A915NYR7_9BILA